MKVLCTIELNGKKLDYLLDTGKRSGSYLNVKDGVLTVRLPYGGTPRQAEELIRSHIDWIEKKLADSTDKSRLPQGFFDGEDFALLGRRRALKIEHSAEYRPPLLEENTLTVYISPNGTQADAARIFQRYVCELCEKYVRDAFAVYSEKLGLYPRKITLKKMTSRWGSCSSNGNISINIDLICFGKECIDYVVVHELCHLKHMNHGAEFWELVSTCCPNYKQLREIMKH